MVERVASEDDRPGSVITRLVFRRFRRVVRIGNVPMARPVQVPSPLHKAGAVIGRVVLDGRTLVNLKLPTQIILIIHFGKEIGAAIV